MSVLRSIADVLSQNNVSPFELASSGLVTSLLAFLTSLTSQAPVQRDVMAAMASEGAYHPLMSTPSAADLREFRLRQFLHVFLGCPVSVTKS